MNNNQDIFSQGKNKILRQSVFRNNRQLIINTVCDIQIN
jgi:hypothetical protein